MKCIINRRAQFSASHRYWLPELSDAENQTKFGRCTRAPGHGHNYELYVSMAGDLDEYGMVLNLSDVRLDHDGKYSPGYLAASSTPLAPHQRSAV